jgi:hypothetical protein
LNRQTSRERRALHPLHIDLRGEKQLVSEGRPQDEALHPCGHDIEREESASIRRRNRISPQVRASKALTLGRVKWDLDVLPSHSGREHAIKQNHFAHWSIVSDWNPEDRDRAVGEVSAKDA